MRQFTLLFLVIALLSPLSLPAAGEEYQKISDSEVVFNSGGAKVLLRFCSPSVVRVEYAFDGILLKDYPTPAVVDDNLDTVSILLEKDGSAYDIHTGALRVVVEPNPFTIKVYDSYQTMLVSDIPGGYVKDGNHIVCTKNFARNESIFGLGEKGDLMDRRGGIYTMWNSDKPCYCIDEDPLYKSIPFFMSSRRYGIFFDNSWRTTFDFSHRDSYTFEADGGAMVYYIITGEDYKDILQKYIGLTGKPVRPPMWALGYSQCRGAYVYQDQAIEVARKFRAQDIPCDVIYQDIGWVDGLQHYAGPHAAIHNVYGLYWDRVVTEEFGKRNPDKRLFQMTRAAFAGMQRYCFSWTGDSGDSRRMTESWAQFAYQIPMMLSAGLSGIPFIDGGVPRKTSWSSSVISVKIDVPSLSYWTMVVVE